MPRVAKIRVLHVIDHMGLGGAQTTLRDLVLEQHHRQEVSPSICCLTEATDWSGLIEKRGVSVFHLNIGRRNPMQIAQVVGRIRRIVAQIQPDLIHTHLFVSGVFGRLAAFVNRVPCIKHEHSTIQHFLGRTELLVDRMLAAKSRAIICPSRAIAQYNIQRKRIDASRVWVVPNGIDAQRFSRSSVVATPRAVREALGLGDSELVVISVGRLEQVKRIDVFLRAARLIADQSSRVRFLIVGDGASRPALEALTQELDLSSHVVYTGRRSDIPDLLSIADVFVLTSDFEAQGVALTEALAMELPCVATAVEGVQEVLGSGRGGLLVPVRDVEAIAAATLKLLRDPVQRKSLGASGRQLVLDEYTMQMMHDRIMGVYSRVLSDR